VDAICPDPPPELLHQLFPWIEREQAALNARAAVNPNARDYALKHFLGLLSWFRLVLLQDAAVLSNSYGSLPIFGYPPFNTAKFHLFASTSMAVMAQAVADAKLALQNLPDQYAHTFQGLITNSNMEQQQIYAEQNRRIAMLTQTVEKMSALLEMQSGSKKARRHKGKGGQFGSLSLFLLFISDGCPSWS
jgi:Centromere DNA-binding protein complex CBF3 subunit, domain 2